MLKLISILILIHLSIIQCIAQRESTILLKGSPGGKNLIDKVFDAEYPSKDIENYILYLASNVGYFNDKLNIITSKTVSAAHVGMFDNKPFLILNPLILHKKKDWNIVSLVAHEFGHIANMHLLPVDKLVLTKDEELQADQFAGLMCRRLQCKSVDLVKAAFKNFEEDETHYGKERRFEAIQRGWDIADKKFDPNDAGIVKQPLAVSIGDKIDLFLIVSQAPSTDKRPDLTHRVLITIKSQRQDLSQDIVAKNIREVKYHLPDNLRSRRFLFFYSLPFRRIVTQGKNYYNNMFSHRLLVHSTFPVKAEIIFVDGSKIMFTKKFKLD